MARDPVSNAGVEYLFCLAVIIHRHHRICARPSLHASAIAIDVASCSERTLPFSEASEGITEPSSVPIWTTYLVMTPRVRSKGRDDYF